MRSRRFGWLLAKDARDLLHSRAYWLLLLASGLLVGHAFLTGVGTYAEMGGASGGPAALAQGLSPLDGIVVPTFGALWLAGTLLLPFVAIRVIAHEKQTGAWALLVQGPAPLGTLVSSKLVVLFAAWLLAWVPAGVALLLWRVNGNHLDAAETCSVLLGHLLFAWLTVGIAAAAAATMESEASAAVVALGFTIGTWALDFIGAERGGLVGALAKVTPGAALHSFEHGLVRTAAIIVMVAIGAAGLGIATVWLDPGKQLSRRRMLTALLIASAAGAVVIAPMFRSSWDWSEDRRNSFPLADELAVRQIREPMQIDVHLAPEDPRLVDLRVGILDKLERLHPGTVITYRARTRTGLFEQADSAYGQVWYAIGARRTMSRSATPAIVLPLLYELAGIPAPAASDAPYTGYPVVHRPAYIGPVFFAGWPLLLVLLFALYRPTRGNRSAP